MTARRLVPVVGLIILARVVTARAARIEVTDAPAAGAVALVSNGSAATILVADDDHSVVKISASLLAEDVERVSGRKPAVVHERRGATPAVVVGSLDRSRCVRELVEAGKLDVADLKGQWESFKIAAIDGSLVVVGSDRRGTAYGALELSRAIGVSPWYWWADVPPRRREAIYVSTDASRVGPPSVNYRGIFLNDEDWGLQPWAARSLEPEVGDIGPRTYARVFELLLRLKANYCWPAMHECTAAFNADPRNRQVADDYAIVMGSSHCEQMLRNNVTEWSKRTHGEWNPVTNLPAILSYWGSRVSDNAKLESTWTVGMRGIHDGAMPGGGTIDEKRERLEQIVSLQRGLLAKHVNPDAAAVPQIFCPYKEVLDIYRAGMKLPDDITIVWPDDNFGYLRQLPDATERTRAGRSGVYYHISYNGRPHDYLWLESIPPALIWHEMTKAHEFGADRLWVVNVGDIKPAEAGMTLFLELAWQIDRYGPEVSRAFLRGFYGEQFGADRAEAIADVKREYFRLCAIRKPETLGWNTTYPSTPIRDGDLAHDPGNDEAMHLVEQWLGLARRADAVAAALAPEQRPAYFQLVGYPASAAAAMAQKMILAEKSRLLAARGEASANAFADRAEVAMRRIEELTRQYNEQLDGKWRHMMDYRPRKLPVFAPPIIARVEDGATKPPAATRPSSKVNALTVDVTRPTKLVERNGVRWLAVDGLGRRGGAIMLSPRPAARTLRTPGELKAHAPAAEYAIDLAGGEGEYEVTVEALPSQPITERHELIIAASFDDGPPEILRFRQESDERARTWQENALCNAMIARTRVRLASGRHTIKLLGVDPSVAAQEIRLVRLTARE